MKHVEVTGNAAHSHEEVWNVVPGLSPMLANVAVELLPSLKRYKRLIIMIGAASLGGDTEKQVARYATELAQVANQNVAMIQGIGGVETDPVMRQIRLETQLLANLALLIASRGVDGEAARHMRLAYRNLRTTCTALWQYEFVPEGNPLPQMAGGR